MHTLFRSALFCIPLFFLRLSNVDAATQIALAQSGCDPAHVSLPNDVIARLGKPGPGEVVKFPILGLGSVDLECSQIQQWEVKGEKGRLWDMSCLTVSNASALATLPAKALPIYTRYRASTGAISSKLSHLTNFTAVQIGTLSSTSTTAYLDLRHSFGSSAFLKSPAKGLVTASVGSEARPWVRYAPKANRFHINAIYLTNTQGGGASGSCQPGQQSSVDFSALYWVLTAAHDRSLGSIITSASLQPFCSQLNQVTHSAQYTKPSQTITHYTSTSFQTINALQNTQTSTSILTQYTPAPMPAITIPSALTSYPITAIEKACSSAAPHPGTVTHYKTILNGKGTVWTDYTSTVSTDVPGQPDATQVVYQTVSRQQSPAVILLAGDSSIEDRAASDNGRSTGWGSFGSGFPLLTDQFVLDFGSGGATTQSYFDNHRGDWVRLLSRLKDGDVVVIEFGINDSHQVIAKNTGLYTVPMQKIVNTLRSRAKGLQIIISSPIPLPTVNGSFRNGTFFLRYLAGSPTYDWAKLARDTANGLGVFYVDHAHAVGAAFQKLGKAQVLALYEDGIHTDAQGSYIVAQAFVKALKCSNAANVVQLDLDAQLLEPYCSVYGVPPIKADNTLHLKSASKVALVQTSLTAPPFCFVKKCYVGRECLPRCSLSQEVS